MAAPNPDCPAQHRLAVFEPIQICIMGAMLARMGGKARFWETKSEGSRVEALKR